MAGKRINARMRRRKVMAFTAAGVAVGVATVATLASWNDSEWVFGGGSGGDDGGVGTSEFDVWQSRALTPPAAGGTGFDDQETNPGGALQFDIDPSALTPGDVMYAPVALQTKADSIGGGLTLQAAVASTRVDHVAEDPAGALWNNLTYSVRVTDDATAAANCDAAGFATAGTLAVDNAVGLGAAITPGTQALEEDRGNVQYYCFQVSLPDNATTQALQGRIVYPAWQFAAVSD